MNRSRRDFLRRAFTATALLGAGHIASAQSTEHKHQGQGQDPLLGVDSAQQDQGSPGQDEAEQGGVLQQRTYQDEGIAPGAVGGPQRVDHVVQVQHMLLSSRRAHHPLH